MVLHGVVGIVKLSPLQLGPGHCPADSLVLANWTPDSWARDSWAPDSRDSRGQTVCPEKVDIWTVGCRGPICPETCYMVLYSVPANYRTVYLVIITSILIQGSLLISCFQKWDESSTFSRLTSSSVKIK